MITTTVSYRNAINYVSELAPALENPSEFLRWAEDIAQLLSYVYSREYDNVTQDLVDKCRESQDYYDED